MSNQSGKLYVVATPIGNLADISFRAVDILKQVGLIAAEDTRHVKLLLNHYGISNKVESFHQHNEDKAAEKLLEKLQKGLSIALVSDAGTPLISDPGLPLIARARAEGVEVVPIPGACALVTALSAAGMPVIPFVFLGFLPRTASTRKTLFKQWLNSPETLVFYESSHRILATLQDMAAILPEDRKIVIARELTKLYETIVKTTIAAALELVEQDENMRKGEFVVIVEGVKTVKQEDNLYPEQLRILTLLMRECSTKTAVELAAEITGARKKLLYQAALDMEKASKA